MEIHSNKGIHKNSTTSLLSCGVMAGLIQAGIFNPWDRALYLSVKNDRSFLHHENFINPFKGVMQTIIQRGLSAGLYFPLEEIYRDILILSNDTRPVVFRPFSTFIAGILAGSTNGLIMNPISAVKVCFDCIYAINKINHCMSYI